ncbi:MAG: hypothetical protein ACETWR_02870 [Anaerolineae bacterium]
MRPEASTCAWCEKVLKGPETTWLVNARAVVDVPEREGKFVPLTLAKSGRTITGFFVTSDSPAKQAGIDVIFSTCSQECASALKAAVREEPDDLGLVII